MGIIKRGILGGFKNKVANIVGTSWKGRAVIKSLPLSVANPRTAAQVANREQIAAISALGSTVLSTAIVPLWNRFAGDISGYNAFVRKNKNQFDVASKEFQNIVIAEGKMMNPVNVTASISGQNVTFSLTTPAGDAFALPTDKIYGFILNPAGWPDARIAYAGDTGVTRAANAGTWTLPDANLAQSGNKIGFVYLRADGTVVSYGEASTILS